MIYRPYLIASIFLLSTSPNALSQTPQVHSLFLCTSCSLNDKQDVFLSTQLAFTDAEQGQVIAVGGGSAQQITDDPKYKSLVNYGKGGLSYLPFLSTESREQEGTDTKAEMEKSILSYLMKLDKTKPVTIMLSDHGWNGTLSGPGTLPPEQAGLALRPRRTNYESSKDLVLSYEDLSKLLEKAGLIGGKNPPTLRIVNEACYGGGVHWLSEHFKNVCTVAVSSSKETASASDPVSSVMWNYVAAEKRANRSVNLTSAFYAGWSTHDANLSEGGALGSTQFVKNILEKFNPDDKSIEKLGDKTQFNWTDKNPIYKHDYMDEAPGCRMNEKLLGRDTAINLEAARNVANTLFPLSTGSGAVYQKAVSDLESPQIKAKSQKMLADYQSLYQAAKAKWNTLTVQEQETMNRDWNSSLGDAVSYLKGSFAQTKAADLKSVRTQEANAFKTFADFKVAHAEELNTYMKNRELAAHLQEMKSFSDLYLKGKVTQDQMSTFRRMVDCESQDL